MNRRLIRLLFKHLLVWVGCIHMVCGPQGVLQGLAWMSMLVSYSAESGVRQAVVDTFSGEKPCPMCRMIERTDFGSDQHDDPLRPDPRGSGALLLAQDWQPARLTRLDPPCGHPHASGSRITGADLLPHDSRRHRPPTPPPRFA